MEKLLNDFSVNDIKDQFEVIKKEFNTKFSALVAAEKEAFIKDGIDESEAIILGYYKVDTVWIPVLENLFFDEEANSSEIIRRFDFGPSKVDVVRTPTDSLVNFIMNSKEMIFPKIPYFKNLNEYFFLYSLKYHSLQYLLDHLIQRMQRK
mgnify:CR=1 FL=1